MTSLEHQERHKQLHQAFDELVADFIIHTNRFPEETTIIELIHWSHQQTQSPAPDPPGPPALALSKTP